VKKVLKANKLKKLTDKKKQNRQSACSSEQISSEGFQAMLASMEFQRIQIFNFETQRKRAKAQSNIANGKRGKAVDFQVPAKNLASALGLNSTDLKNTTGAICGDGVTTNKESTEAVSDYLYLINCTEEVNTTCDISSIYNDTTTARYTECLDLMTAFTTENTRCQGLKIAEAGACWTAQEAQIDVIKAGGCLKFSSTTASDVANLKTACVDTVFRNCKTKEDAAVAHSANCTSGTVKSTSEINKEVIFSKETLGGRFLYDPADDEDVDVDDITNWEIGLTSL